MRLASILTALAVSAWFAGCVTDPCQGICPSGTVCDEAKAACVPDPATNGSCAGDDDCPLAELGRCAPSVRRCVACLTDGDCPTQRCNKTTFTCAAVGCASPADCVDKAGRPYCSAAGLCIACLADVDCPTTNGLKGVCNKSDNSCGTKKCTVDGDCSANPAAPRCDASSGACVACVSDAQCTGPGETRCQASTRRCVGCLSTSDCDADRGWICDLATNACRDTGCDADSACAPGRCETATRTCVACFSASDCPFGGSCDQGACVAAACANNSDCPWPLSCAEGACVACAASSDCRPGQLCTDGACAEPSSCTSDTACLAGRACVSGRCAEAACKPDAFEPNDDVTNARVVDPSRVPTVAASLCANDADVYLYDFWSGAGATVTLTYDAAKPAPRLTLVTGTTGAPIQAAPLVPGKLVAVVEAAPSGTRALLVRVDGHSAAVQLDYTLAVDIASSGVCANDVREPNDTQAQAIDVAPGAQTGAACPLEQDWYAVDVPAGDHVVATLQLLDGAATGSASLELYALDSGSLRRVAYGFTSASQPNAPTSDAKAWVLVRNLGPRKLRYTLGIDVVPMPPSNDTCAARTSLATNATTSGTLRAAADDAATPCGAGIGEVFYDLNLTAASRVRITADAATPVSVSLAASCIAADVACAADATTSALDVEALPAGRYVIQVAGSAQAELFGLSTVVTPATATSAGETCTAATIINPSASKVSVTGSVALAADDRANACGRTGGEVVYGWSQPAAQRVRLHLAAFEGASLTLVSEGSCQAGGTCVAAGADGVIDLDLPWVDAGDWRVVVDGGRWTGGAYTLEVELLEAIPAPANDLCDGALALEATASGDTRGAADDAAPLCSGAPGGGRDVVYRFSLTEESEVELALDADFDAALSLSSGSCSAETARTCGDGPKVKLLEPALAAGDYLVRVDGWGPERGLFTLTRTTRPPEPLPSNDLCGDAALLSFVDGLATVSGSTRRAQADVAPSACLDGTRSLAFAGADVIYAVDVPAGERVDLQLVPEAGFDAALYALDTCGSQSCVAASDRSFVGGGAESLSLANATANVQRHLVVVDAWRAGATGAFTLTATVVP